MPQKAAAGENQSCQQGPAGGGSVGLEAAQEQGCVGIRWNKDAQNGLPCKYYFMVSREKVNRKINADNDLRVSHSVSQQGVTVLSSWAALSTSSLKTTKGLHLTYVQANHSLYCLLDNSKHTHRLLRSVINSYLDFTSRHPVIHAFTQRHSTKALNSVLHNDGFNVLSCILYIRLFSFHVV